MRVNEAYVFPVAARDAARSVAAKHGPNTARNTARNAMHAERRRPSSNARSRYENKLFRVYKR